MKSARLLSALIPLLVTTAIAQDHPAVNAQANSVYVGADGKFEAAPDTAVIQFNVSVQDETSQAAFQRGSKNVSKCGRHCAPMELTQRPPISDFCQCNRSTSGSQNRK